MAGSRGRAGSGTARLGNNARGVSRKFSRTNRKRLYIVFFLIIAAFAVMIFRLIQINVASGEQYQKNVLSIMNYEGQTIPYKRGDIMDRNKTVLATSEKIYSLILAPKSLLDGKSAQEAAAVKTQVEELLNKYFDISKDDVAAALNDQPDSYYVVMKKGLSYDQKEAYEEYLASLKEDPIGKGVWFEESYKRTYPYNSLACDTIGFLSSDNTGLWGLEKYYNSTLSGVNGRSYGLVNEDIDYQNVTKEPENGDSLVTTIDANIQRIVEKYIAQFEKKVGAENVGVLVMNPNNGEILAMASSPVFDLNSPYDLTASGYTKKQLKAMTNKQKSNLLTSIWKNFCVNDSYEPGSIAKTMTVSYALDQDLVSDSDQFDCEGQLTASDGTVVTCNSVHGTISLQDALVYSCNVAMMHIADKIGVSNFVNMQKMFGLGQLTGVDLEGEVSCSNLVYSKDKMGPVELWTSSFGQGYNLTMVQLASAFCSIVNGGNYYKPHVVSEILNDSGNTVKVIDKTLVRTTISQQTSKWMREALYQTVEKGTGTPAQVPGYKIGGKTGTAEVGVRGSKDRLVSFIGAAPIDDPQLVVYVVVDRAHADDQGQSSFASSIAGKIFYEALPYMQIFPTETIDENELQDFEDSLADDEKTTDQEASSEEGSASYDNSDSSDADNSEAAGSAGDNTGAESSSADNSEEQ